MVWVGSVHQLPQRPYTREPTPDWDYHYIEEVPAEAAVRQRFPLPFVSYVGSHEGCGCGYNSDDYTIHEELVVDILPLFDALFDEERAEFMAEQHSRERLKELVEQALVYGPVEVFSCWDGDQKDPPLRTVEVQSTWFSERTRPFEERVKYVIMPHQPLFSPQANEFIDERRFRQHQNVSRQQGER